jgi:hypothetical protein
MPKKIPMSRSIETGARRKTGGFAALHSMAYQPNLGISLSLLFLPRICAFVLCFFVPFLWPSWALSFPSAVQARHHQRRAPFNDYRSICGFDAQHDIVEYYFSCVKFKLDKLKDMPRK